MTESEREALREATAIEGLRSLCETADNAWTYEEAVAVVRAALSPGPEPVAGLDVDDCRHRFERRYRRGGQEYCDACGATGSQLAALGEKPVAGLDVLPTFEVGQVVGDLQSGRRRHDWCSMHGDIGPMESIDGHARKAHGSGSDAIRKARKVLKRAAALGEKP